MSYLKTAIFVATTCLSLISAASTATGHVEENIFAQSSNKVLSLAETWSPTADGFKASLNAVREEIVCAVTEAQAAAQTKLQQIQAKRLSPDQQFAECEAVISQQEALMRAVNKANQALDQHLWEWLGNILLEKFCPLYGLYAANDSAEITSREDELVTLSKQITQNDFMRLVRKCNDPELLEMISTFYAMKDDSKAAYKKFELLALEESARTKELDEAEQQRKDALEKFVGCIRVVTNCAQTLAEIQTDTYDGFDEPSAAKIALRNRTSLTTAWAIAAEQLAKPPAVLALSRFLRHETAHAINRKFLETFSSTLRRVNQLRIKAMANHAKKSGRALDLFLTNTSFLRLDELSLTNLLGDEAGWIIQNRDALRLHPAFGEQVFLPDQMFNSLLALSDDASSYAKFPLPTSDETNRFVEVNPTVFAGVQSNSAVLQAQLLAKLKSKFADTLPLAERAQLFAPPTFDEETKKIIPNPYDARFEEFVNGSVSTVEVEALAAAINQELLQNARYNTAHNHLLEQRKEQALAFIRTIHEQFFDVELDFTALGIDPLSDFGKLWARYHAIRDLTCTLNAEAFKVTAHDFFKLNARRFFDPAFTASTFAVAPLTEMLAEDFWSDPFTTSKTDDESVARLAANRTQAQATYDLFVSMPDSDSKQLAKRLLGTWVTASVGKEHDVWVEAGRDALAISYLQIQSYLPGSDDYKIWASVKQLADVLATTKTAEKEALATNQPIIMAACTNETTQAVLSTYVKATETIFNLAPNLGLRILLNAVGINE